MQCPSAANLVRYVSGDAGAQDAVRIGAHVSGCQACAETVAALRETWAALDAWQPGTTGVDLAGRVLTAIEAEATAPRRHRWRWPAFTRVAASVVIATGLGVGAGRLVSGSRASDREITVADSSNHDVLHALAVAFVATDSATGIALQFERRADEEGR
jgi:anti-sigma factor RsiW